MSEQNQNNKQEPSVLKGIIIIVFVIIFIGGCMAYGTNNAPNDFDWNNKNDVNSYLDYLEKNR